MKYNITTNSVALSRAWTALNMIDISNVPQVNTGDDVEEIASLLVRNIGTIPEAFNMFFQAITEQQVNFVKELSDKEATEITINFCRNISNQFLSLIKKYLKESKELKDSITMKIKLMQIAKIKEMMDNPEMLANILKSSSTLEKQD